jgi:8-oxo-dGTP diphosphatase
MENKKSPRLGCAAVVKHEDSILMGIRGKEPNYGKWILPGGGVNFLESVKATLEREILEETNMSISIENLIGAYEIISPPNEHRVILYWWAKYIDGDIRPSSDLLDAKFLTRDEVQKLIESGSVTGIVTQVLKDIGWA